MMKRLEISLRRITAGLGAGLLVFAGVAWGQDASVNELRYRVQAAFLYNFARFVEWPEGAMAGGEERFRVCVYDDPVFADVIEATVSGKSVDGHAIQVQRPVTPAESADCQILYVGSLGEHPLLIEHLRTQMGTLVVGEGDRFIEQGGSIAFFTEAGRIRFAINPDAAARAGLRVSSKLLAVARIES